MFNRGDIVRHFKGRTYKVLEFAKHSEDNSDYVVYMCLYEPYDVYIRPLEMFCSKVDTKKYPDCTQKYRFERVKMD